MRVASFVPLADIVHALERLDVIEIRGEPFIETEAVTGVLRDVLASAGAAVTFAPNAELGGTAAFLQPAPEPVPAVSGTSSATSGDDDDDLARQRASEAIAHEDVFDEDAFLAYQMSQVSPELNTTGGGARREVGEARVVGPTPDPPEYDPTPQGPVLPDGPAPRT